MTPEKIESIELDNGLTLNLFDLSRKVASDRWLVKLEAAIDINVTEDYFNDKVPMPVPISEMRAKLGDRATYTYQAERNFVDAKDKDALLGQLQSNLLAQIRYYSHTNFAGRFLIKEYARCRHLPNANR